MNEKQLGMIADFMTYLAGELSYCQDWVGTRCHEPVYWPLTNTYSVRNGRIVDEYGVPYYTRDEFKGRGLICPICGQWQEAKIRALSQVDVSVHGRDSLAIDPGYRNGDRIYRPEDMFGIDREEMVYVCPYHNVRMIEPWKVHYCYDKPYYINNITGFPETSEQVVRAIEEYMTSGCDETYPYDYFCGDADNLDSVVEGFKNYYWDILYPFLPFVQHYRLTRWFDAVIAQAAEEDAEQYFETMHEAEEAEAYE